MCCPIIFQLIKSNVGYSNVKGVLMTRLLMPLLRCSAMSACMGSNEPNNLAIWGGRDREVGLLGGVENAKLAVSLVVG